MTGILEWINRFVWGGPALILILGTGILLTIYTVFAQLRLFPDALRTFISKFKNKKVENGVVSPFQALCTALAATVGTGNIAGVAGAIALGGPGSVFWMWIGALFGMVTKFAEAALAVHYARTDSNGCRTGGPMLMIEQGMGKKWKWLAATYCFFGVIAAFGIGNATQINAVIDSINSIISATGLKESYGINISIGVCFAIALAVILIGGASRIGNFAERLVPFAAVGYILMCVVVLISNANKIPSALMAIFTGAFSPRAATGGFLGSVFVTIRVGVSRGVFTNEAGMGTASIAHAGAKVAHPVQQGLMGIMEVFIDTLIICTMTALVILCSGIYIPYGIDEGASLTSRAFSCTYGNGGSILVSVFLCCFAFATMLGWGLYGLRCAQYLFGGQVWRLFVCAQSVIVVISTLLKTETIWMISEIVNGLMAIPNLIALIALAPTLRRLLNEYSYKTNDAASLQSVKRSATINTIQEAEARRKYDI